MKRVAALYLPMWPIERLRRAEPTARPPEAAPAAPVQRNGGWRPGARWARDEKLLPGTGRGTAHDVRGGEGSPQGIPSRKAPSTSFAGPPPRAGEEFPPLVTSLRDTNRVVIAAACSRARALGLAPGMALSQARAQVRGLDIRPADPEGDLAALNALAILAARRWSPIVAVEGEDTLFLDLTGTAHLFGGERRFARRLIRLLARYGFTAHIAIADTPGAAWALARHHRLEICPASTHPDALAPLPIEGLRIETKQAELLHRLGIDSIGQLAAIPRAPLVKRFGAGLATRVLQALGSLPEPLDPIVPPEAIAVAQRFAEPIQTADAIAHWIGTLVPRLAGALEARGLGATRIELIADRIDGVPQRIRIGLARPNRNAAHILRLLTRRIEDVAPGYGIDAIALHVRRSGVLGPEPFIERLDEEAASDLAPLVDTLATRIGLSRLWRMRPVESDVPERAAARAPVLDPPERGGARPKVDAVTQLDRNPALQPWHPDWPRPVRLLARPELLDHVIAELPDQAPRRFTWRGTRHSVIRADGPERIHGEWWKRDAERASVRDYFQVEDEAGHRYWLFRRGDGERAVTGDLSWYLHGVFG